MMTPVQQYDYKTTRVKTYRKLKNNRKLTLDACDRYNKPFMRKRKEKLIQSGLKDSLIVYWCQERLAQYYTVPSGSRGINLGVDIIFGSGRRLNSLRSLLVCDDSENGPEA